MKGTDDFGDYIKLLRMVVSIGYSNFDEEIVILRETLRKLYFAYFEFVDRPQVFDNLTQLIEVDSLHNEMYEQHEHLVYGRDVGVEMAHDFRYCDLC